MLAMYKFAGHKRWVIAYGYIPPASTDSSRQLANSDAMCVLNSGEHDEHIEGATFLPIGGLLPDHTI